MVSRLTITRPTGRHGPRHGIWVWFGFTAVIGTCLQLHESIKVSIMVSNPNHRSVWFMDGPAVVGMPKVESGQLFQQQQQQQLGAIMDGTASSLGRGGDIKLASLTNSTDGRPRRLGRVYMCGWEFAYNLHVIFEPEYEPVWDADVEPYGAATSDDILVYGLNGPCSQLGLPNGLTYDTVSQFLDYFPGKVLIANGETGGDNLQFARMEVVRMDNNKNNSMNNGNESRHEDDGEGRWNRLFQIGPYPQMALNGDDHDAAAYADFYNRHSATVYFMVSFMNFWFGPPPSPPPPAKQESSSSSSTTIFSSFTNLWYGKAPVSTSMTSSSPSSSPKPQQLPPLNDTATAELGGTGTNTEVWSWWTDPMKRRNNTGLYSPAVAYFTSNCVHFRQEAAIRLSDIVPVHYPQLDGCSIENRNGLDNMTVATDVPNRGNYAQNYLLFRDYKYCLVMENSAVPGYITEKIVNAFLGGCLPIYYGTAEILDIFHEEAFIYYDIHNPEPALELVKHLEENPAEYHRRLQETPILRDGQRTMDRYFSLGWPSQGTGDGEVTLRDKIRTRMGVPLKI